MHHCSPEGGSTFAEGKSQVLLVFDPLHADEATFSRVVDVAEANVIVTEQDDEEVTIIDCQEFSQLLNRKEFLPSPIT